MRLMLLSCGALCISFVSAPRRARALTLHVDRGATCLDENTLRAALDALLPPEIAEAATEVSLVGSRIDPRTLVMRVRHPDGAVFERTFSPAPERCPHLHQAVALALAFALKAIPQEEASTQEEHHAEPQPRARRLEAFALGLGPLLGVGVGSSLAFGGELGAALIFRHAALRASGLAAPSLRVKLGTGHFDTVSAAARMDACGRLALSEAVHGELCLGALAGRLFVRGAGFDQPLAATLRQIAMGGSLGLSWQWTEQLGMRASGSLLAGLEPLHVVVRDQAGTIEQDKTLPRLVGLFVLALEYTLFRARPSTEAHPDSRTKPAQSGEISAP